MTKFQTHSGKFAFKTCFHVQCNLSTVSFSLIEDAFILHSARFLCFWLQKSFVRQQKFATKILPAFSLKQNSKKDVLALSDSGHRYSVLGEEAVKYSSLLVSVLGAPIVISAFLFGLIIHDRFQKNSQEHREDCTKAAKASRVVGGTQYTFLSKEPTDELSLDSENTSDDDEVIFNADSAKSATRPLLKTPM